MTEQEAIDMIRACDESGGPETYAEAAAVFAVLFGREPDADDGTRADLWSHACAVVAS